MKATLWLKSHSEAPNIEDYPVEIHDNRCEAKFIDDADDLYGYKCGGLIKWRKGPKEYAEHEGKCEECGAGYLTDDNLGT